MPRPRKPKLLRDHMIEQLRAARAFTLTAIRDLERADRIDALDSIDFARRKLANAANCIRETLP